MKKVILILGIIIAFNSCNSDDDQNIINCGLLKTGLINVNSELLNTEINKLTQDLQPISTANDVLGHSENLDELINRLNTNCNEITVSKICYACIDTLILQSEIKFILDSIGIQIERTVDILTSENDVLISIRIHTIN